LEDTKQVKDELLQVNYLINEDAFQVNIKPNDFQKAEILVVDASGKIMYKNMVTANDVAQLISAKGWPSGAYLVQLISDKKHIAFKKTVKF
jgi:Secretion system C-terminal sorting domain